MFDSGSLMYQCYDNTHRLPSTELSLCDESILLQEIFIHFPVLVILLYLVKMSKLVLFLQLVQLYWQEYGLLC